MKKIEAIQVGNGRNKCLKILMDGKFALKLEAEVAAKERLEVGQELSSSQVEALVKANNAHRCLNAAARYLGYRPRSESELRLRLHQRGFDDISVEDAIIRLKQQGLLDDKAFAQFWIDNRQAFRPRSQRLTRLELRQKGVASDIIAEVVETVDDEDNAYRAVENKARRLPMSDYYDFRRRLGEYLKRRGFSYDVINRIVERLWEEQGGGKADNLSHNTGQANKVV